MAKFLKIRDKKTDEDVLVNFDWVKKITTGRYGTAVIHFACTDEGVNEGDHIVADTAFWEIESALEE